MAQSQSLKDYRWKHRIVILIGTEGSDIHLMKAYTDSAGIVDRKLLFFNAKSDYLISLNTNKSIRLDKPNFIDPKYQCYLIGLDGGVKQRKERLLTQKELFDIIDQMPMRIREIKGGYE